MRKLETALSASLLVLLLVADQTAQGRADSPLPNQFRDMRLSRIVGMRVENQNAEVLGAVQDLALNPGTGQVEYVLVGSSGFLGLGTRVRALPAQLLSSATIIRHTLSAILPKPQWEQAPAFQSEAEALAHPLSVGRQAVPQSNLRLGRSLLDQPVLDPAHQPVGVIDDFLVDLAAHKPVLVLVCAGQVSHTHRCWAAPLRGLTFERGRRLILPTNRLRLEQAPQFSEQAWGTVTSRDAPRVYRLAGSTES